MPARSDYAHLTDPPLRADDGLVAVLSPEGRLDFCFTRQGHGEDPMLGGFRLAITSMRVRLLMRHLPALRTQRRVDLYMRSLIRTCLRGGMVVYDYLPGEGGWVRFGTLADLDAAISSGVTL